MSILTTIKSAAQAVASETSKVVKNLSGETSKAYNTAKSVPANITCSGCRNTLNVPAELFDWKCKDGHDNKYADAKCQSCPNLQPKKRPEPQIKCGTCGTVNNIPFTTAEKNWREAGRGAKYQYEYLKSKPGTFHCTHCNNLLLVPTGPWGCNTCTETNNPEADVCAKCTQKKADQKVMCGICGRSTQIPSMNIMDALGKGWRDINREWVKIYYDLRKHPYVTCTRCSTHIPIPKPRRDSVGSMSTSTSTSTSASSHLPSQPRSLTSGSSSSSSSSRSSSISSSISSSTSSQKPELDVVPPPTDEELKSIAEMELDEAQTIPCPSCGLEVRYTPPRRGSIVLPGEMPEQSRRASMPSSYSSSSSTSGISGPYETKSKPTPAQIEGTQPGLSAPFSLPPSETEVERQRGTELEQPYRAELERLSLQDPALGSSKTSTTTIPKSQGQQRRSSQPGQDTTDINKIGA